MSTERQANILIVDDNPKNLLALSSTLADLNQRIVTAGSGREALKCLLREDFAVILLDVQMPGMNGFDTAKLIRERGRSRHTPIIFITAFDKREVDIAEAYSVGAVDYMYKPISPYVLKSKVSVFVDIFHRTEELSERERQLENQLEIVQKRKNRLREAYDKLEDLIQERTADLASANTALQAEVSERKRAEEELAEHARMLEKLNENLALRNKELDEFSYVASHDLQEPLRKITSFSELLREDAGDSLGETALQDLEFIVASARRMHQLIQDLLNLSRSGRAAMSICEIPLEECVQAALDSVATRIEETRARIIRTSLPQVRGDRTLLTQLYQNLIGNALKFVREGEPEVHLTMETVDGEVVFGVQDNGIGIAEDHMAQIFAPFRRLHGQGEYEGTGIGLAICRKAVERHGGRIWVESAPGRGSHFRFTLNTRAEVEPDEHRREAICHSAGG